MAVTKELEKVSSIKYGNTNFSPPEWYRIDFPEPDPKSPFDPNIFIRKESFKNLDTRTRELITILDEKIHITDSNTVLVTQWILGYHPRFFPLAKMHQGWQGEETIRQFYRLKMTFGDGSQEIANHEVDLSNRDPIDTSKWKQLV
jgi:hypothetical protein